MSIEANLASIAASLAAIADHLTKQPTTMAAPVVPAAVPVMVPEPVVVPEPIVAPTPAAPTPAAPSCPITDQASLVSYVMTSYKEMGPTKGNQIQGVLAALGITNINEAQPGHYVAIFNGVEALKVQ